MNRVYIVLNMQFCFFVPLNKLRRSAVNAYSGI